MVSMATDSYHRVIMGKSFKQSSAFVLIGSSSFLKGNQHNYNILDELKFRPDSTKDCGVSCP